MAPTHMQICSHIASSVSDVVVVNIRRKPELEWWMHAIFFAKHIDTPSPTMLKLFAHSLFIVTGIA